jgi:hypothetical protein
LLIPFTSPASILADHSQTCQTYPRKSPAPKTSSDVGVPFPALCRSSLPPNSASKPAETLASPQSDSQFPLFLPVFGPSGRENKRWRIPKRGGTSLPASAARSLLWRETGGIRTHVGSGEEPHAPCVADCGSRATRHPFCARERGRACLSGPIVCSFTPTRRETRDRIRRKHARSTPVCVRKGSYQEG